MCVNLANEILSNPSAYTVAEVIAALRFKATHWAVR